MHPRIKEVSPIAVIGLVEATAEAITDITVERALQDAKHGGPEHDDKHTPGDFAKFIDERLGYIHFGTPDGRPDRQVFVEVAALAVAAIQSIDRKAQTRAAQEEGCGECPACILDKMLANVQPTNPAMALALLLGLRR